MALKPVALNKDTHSKTRISQKGTVEHLRNMHIAPLSSNEFIDAAIEYPIVFMLNKDNNYSPILMWGTIPEENLFIENDKWCGGYLPAILRFFPFIARPAEEENKLTLGIYDKAEIVNEVEGELILDENGEISKWFSIIVESMHHVFDAEKNTAVAMKKIADMDLFIKQELTIVTPNKEDSIIGGFHVIDEKKFMALSGEEITKMHDEKLLELVYAHLISLNNLRKLTQIKHKNTRSK